MGAPPPLSHFIEGAAKAPKGERSAWKRGIYRARHLALASELKEQGTPLSAPTIRIIKKMK